MPSTRVYSRDFAGGEISPEMFGRIDDAKFQSGAAVLRNFIVTPAGAVKNRAGFAYVNSTKNNGVARLIPFTFNLNQTMVIELGNQYARFHTNGETLQYLTTGLTGWVPPSSGISWTLTTPSIITWTGHGLVTGNPIRFYVYGTPPIVLPGGLQLDYTYTVQVIDANTFTMLDGNGNPVTLTGTGGGSGGTQYAGSGTASATLNLIPNQNFYTYSSVLNGLSSQPVAGGIATLSATINASFFISAGALARAEFQYSIDGVNWYDFASYDVNFSGTVTASIPVSNIDLVQLRIFASGGVPSSGSVAISAAITAWSVTIPTGGGPGNYPLRAYFYYGAGKIISYGGQYYNAVVSDAGGVTTPGTNPAVWYQLPADLSYEIPTPYLAADLFNIKYVQSNDIMTLTNPNYPPQLLERLSATAWTMIPESFVSPLATPLNVAVAASPGYQAKIASVSTGGTGYTGQALITTVSSHTLALGDGVYIANLTDTPSGGSPIALDGFYMVAAVPVDGSGNLIKNEVYLMDYSGNNLMFDATGSYSGAGTIQFGTKIFNITSPYAVQAFASDGVSSSLLSASVSVLNNLDVPGSYNTISWSAVAGAANYYVYKQFNGLWGFIGTTPALTFVDNNIAPDMGITPGIPYGVFASAGNYPGAVSYFQQRKCFAGSTDGPSNAWMSNSGTESMFNYSLPSKDTDAVAFRVAALKADVIQHIVPMLQLIFLTSEAEYVLTPVNSSAITPSSIDINPQSYVGASNVQPTVINISMVYAAAQGGHVQELKFAWTVNGYMSQDLSLRAAHLFDTFTIVDQSYSKAPWPIVWFPSSSGNLLGLTYVPDQEIESWHHHDTQGTFESSCCVSEGNEQVQYCVVNRAINGQTVRHVERQASRVIDPNDFSTWFFVDAGISQSFVNPVTTITGLTWLEGCTVAVLADGGVQTKKVVTGGTITLDHAASIVTVGLPYTCDLQTLPAVMQVDGYGQGRTKNINKGWVKVFQSSSIFMGPDENHLVEIRQRTTEPWGSPPSLQTAELEVLNTPSWQQSGQVFIHGSDPLPLEVVGLTLEVVVGG